MSGESDFNLLRDAAQILGLTVIGGFVPSMLAGLRFNMIYQQMLDGQPVGDPFSLQVLLDGLIPYLLPIALVGFCYWMLKKLRFTPVKVILIIAVIAFVLGAWGKLI